MASYVALLRAVNLGSRNRVAMADLRALVEGLGAEDVSTYVQSGNVVFRSGSRSAAKLADAIERGLASELGLDVRVLVRTGAELAKLVDGNPFPKAKPGSLHVTFLADAPAKSPAAALDPEVAKPDGLELIGRHVYLHCPGGYGRSKLDNAFFEKQLGVAATTRNWRTVEAIAELADG